MKKSPTYESHLTSREVLVPTAGEWRPHFRGWCWSQTGGGVSYWKEKNGVREIPMGSVLVFPAESEGLLWASQGDTISVSYFCVEPEKLLGLLTFREHQYLTRAARRGDQAVRIVAAPAPFHSHSPATGTSAARLQLVQSFLDVFELDLEHDTAAEAHWIDGRGRLKQIMNQMPASDFARLSVSELAPMVPCSPRHLHRIFREEMGASFREKQIELRLAKACELLSSSDAKVVDVALESGYQSSSVFSELFKKHLGLSPGQWRRQGLKLGAGGRRP